MFSIQTHLQLRRLVKRDKERREKKYENGHNEIVCNIKLAQFFIEPIQQQVMLNN